MKSVIMALNKKYYFLFIPFFSSCATYQLQPSRNVEDNLFIFRRGYNSAAVRMKVFVDGKLVGKVGGYRYISLSLRPGTHEVYFKFSPLVSRSAKRFFTILPDSRTVFTVKKGLFNYGLEIREEDSLPVDFKQKRKPKER